MKDYINQIYNEGLGTTFYLKPINYLEKKIKNKNILKILKIFIKVLYTLLVLTFAIWMFILKWPI